MNSSHQAFSWIPPSKIYFLKIKMLIFPVKSWASPDILRYILQNYLLSNIVKFPTKIVKTETPPQRSLVCFEHPKNKQILTNIEQLHEWNSLVLFPLLSLWDWSDFNKSCAFLSTFKFGRTEVSHGFYIKCLVHFRVNLFLIRSCITQCLILLGLLPTGTWQWDLETTSFAS